MADASSACPLARSARALASGSSSLSVASRPSTTVVPSSPPLSLSELSPRSSLELHVHPRHVATDCDAPDGARSLLQVPVV
eukprot:7071182-Pyramimonas_sp.AAC.1